jgi:uncharacterized protein YndB with AHSA1/START domain
MTTTAKKAISVTATVKAPVEKVWMLWTTPEHIMNWNNASPDWHTPNAQNDLREGGRFSYRMESRDGSTGFDFGGTYQKLDTHREILYAMDDDRKARVLFIPRGNQTTIEETFEPESSNPEELQRMGWQAILDNFKQYAERPGTLETMHLQAIINAPVEKVYKTMLGEQSYRQWTSVFSPTSFFRGSWEKGATIHFIGLDKDGGECGMVSRIRENVPNKFVSIEHRGVLKNGIEITDGQEVAGWAGALENYTFAANGNQTMLSVDMDANQEWHAYFAETWPKALNKLKEMCEA